MKFDFWIELPRCLLEIRKEETTEEELLFVARLGNSYEVIIFYKYCKKISANENDSLENKEEMSLLINKIYQRKTQLACEAIKFSLNIILKINDSIEKKIAEKFHQDNMANLTLMMKNLGSNEIPNERRLDLLLKIKIHLQTIILVSKYLAGEIENSGDVQKIYFSKVKTVVDKIISSMHSKSNNLMKVLSFDSENQDSKLSKASECAYSFHKYSVSTVSSERNEDENSFFI